jgi:hypothetical protein
VTRETAFVLAAGVVCVLLSFVTYWPFLGDYFVWDDFFFLRAVRNHAFPEVMRRAFLFQQGTRLDEATLFWRPSIDLYFFAAKPLGIHAQPFHAANVALHGAAAALGVVLVWRLTGSLLTAAAAGLLFTVAPTYDYAVTWIAQISEVAGGFLILATLLMFHAYLTRREPSVLLGMGVVLLVVAALLTKESTVMVAALLPAIAVVVPPQQRHKTNREIALVLAPVLLLCGVFFLAMEIHEYSQPGHFQSIGTHMATNLMDYLRWMVYPHRYGEAEAWRTAGAAVFLLAGCVAIVLRQRTLGFFFVWTLIALVPFTGFDGWIELRYTYLATLPFIAFVVHGMHSSARLAPSYVRPVATGAIAVGAAVALVVAPMRTRDQQAYFSAESARYEAMVDAVRAQCGAMPPDSFAYVVRPPYMDLWQIHTPAALNLYYTRLNAVAVPELPGLAAFIDAPVCAIEYDAATEEYRRIE